MAGGSRQTEREIAQVMRDLLTAQAAELTAEFDLEEVKLGDESPVEHRDLVKN